MEKKKGAKTRLIQTVTLGILRTILASGLLFVLVDKYEVFDAWFANLLVASVLLLSQFMIQEKWIYKT